MKIYTKKGDGGVSSVLGGDKFSKGSLVFDVLGCVDELNAVLGVAVSFSSSGSVKSIVRKVQNDLFFLGSDIASFKSSEGFPKISEKHVSDVEEVIDVVSSSLSVQKNFILPNGSSASCFFHLARGVCRRLERCLVRFSNEEKGLNSVCLKYVNRLSDLFFVLAREENKHFSEENPDYTLY